MENPESNGIVLVMGVTGVGKSHFINKLKAGSVQSGNSLESQTSHCQAVQIYLDSEQKESVTVVDTPGFDDTYRSDGEILSEISSFLAAQYAANVPLFGIIYLHRITDNRMTGSSRKYLQLFRSLCGDHAMGNVILVTTWWDAIHEENLGAAKLREQELVDKYWAPMQDRGSYATQFDGSRDSAESLVLELFQGRRSVVLDIQRELVDKDKEMGSTAAGRQLGTQLDQDLDYYTDTLAKIEEKMRDASGQKDRKELLRLREERSDVANIIKQLQRSKRRMGERIGVEMKKRIELEKKRKRDKVITGVSVLTTVLSITLTVVKFVAMGAIG
ncbi:hypothetical protein MKZ38_000236 [Zalerion maritima]|uniref:AIG1-type G domain-containing protein n=1 Tax=Zalerion maritima TaxID=339359 RepID=A0AAD5WMQ4_9PEZI|nr:hypothetical protein MKZ38_000236 [Zalerion maritima]